MVQVLRPQSAEQIIKDAEKRRMEKERREEEERKKAEKEKKAQQLSITGTGPGRALLPPCAFVHMTGF